MVQHCMLLPCEITFGAGSVIALALAALGLALSGFVSGSEISYFSLTAAQLDSLDECRQGSTIRRLLSKPERLLATILIANNLVNVTIVVLCNYALGPIFEGLSEVWSFVLQTVLLTFLILLFGEILPKLYCSNNAVSWAKMSSGGLMVIYKLLAPVSKLLVGSTWLVNRVVTKQIHAVTTDELSQALEMTKGAGKGDKEILEGILRYGNTRASEIMTPRVDITDIDMGLRFDEVLKVVVESGYSRIPVYENTEDNIKGILFSRDLLPYIGKVKNDFDWHKLLRQPYFVPEARMIDDLLEDFRKRKQHLAIVVDEYGGTQGLVTMEDVLEEIVGDIDDEYDTVEQSYKRLQDNTYEFEGRTLLTDFFRATALDEADYEAVTEGVETLAGMLLQIKGDFVKQKEVFVYGQCRFTVTEAEEHRIVSVRVKVDKQV